MTKGPAPCQQRRSEQAAAEGWAEGAGLEFEFCPTAVSRPSGPQPFLAENPWAVPGLVAGGHAALGAPAPTLGPLSTPRTSPSTWGVLPGPELPSKAELEPDRGLVQGPAPSAFLKTGPHPSAEAGEPRPHLCTPGGTPRPHA